MMIQRAQRGVVQRDGVEVHYSVHGDEHYPTLFLLPGWMIADSRLWDEQVDALSADHRIVTYDSRGTGRSSRPTEPESYDPQVLLADAMAVLEASASSDVIAVGNSFGGALAYLLASLHPERVRALVLIDPTINPTGAAEGLTAAMLDFEHDHGDDVGWHRYTRASMHRDYDGFVRWFVETAVPEPGADDERRAGVAMGLATTPEVLAASVAARAGIDPEVQARTIRVLGERIIAPTLLVHGDCDEICPPWWSIALAQILGTEAVLLPGAGHVPQQTFAGELNRMIRAFVAEVVASSS